MFASATFGFFAGGAGIVAPLPGGYTEDFYTFPPGNASAGYRFNSDGSIDLNRGGFILNSQQWSRPPIAGAGTALYIRATVTAGPTPSGAATGTWLSLASSQSWLNTATPNDTEDTTLLIEISNTASTAGLLTSGTYQFVADSNLL